MLYELREYKIKKDCGKKFAKLMEEVILPYQEKMGMDVVGSFTWPENEDMFIWIRRFKDEKHKEELYDKVYGSDHWINEVRPMMGDMLLREESDIKTIIPTKNSRLQ